MTALIKSMKNFQFADKIYFCIALILDINDRGQSTTHIRPIISDRIFLYVLPDKICLYFIMNSYVEKRGM